MIFALRFSNRKIIDIRQAKTHKTIVIELPIFISEGAKPVSGVIVPLLGKAGCDAISGESPKLFDQPVVQFLYPFCGLETPRFLACRSRIPNGFSTGSLACRLVLLFLDRENSSHLQPNEPLARRFHE
jgi:hypothetical protein